ncbi:MAG: dienelactone hydrolase family protein [Burkholderiales bacterium]
MGRDQIPAQLLKPDGPGPFPAVVMAHDCSGLGPASSGTPGRWAAELVGLGYVVILPDSFGTRGFPNGVCTDPSPRRVEVSPLRRARDVHDAAAYLRTLPFVDARRIGLMGGSHGGATTLIAMRSAGFAAAIALYPRCETMRGIYRPSAPVRILTGEKDDWTPAGTCERLHAFQEERAPGRVRLTVYPGATHSFDFNAPRRWNEYGKLLAFDATATRDAQRRVEAFLDEVVGTRTAR